MRKTLMTLGVSLLMVTSLYGQDIALNINDQIVETAVAPIIQDEVTLVPLRIISENLGAEVDWDGPNRTVAISDGEKEIKLVINQNTATINGEKKELLLAPKLIDSITMVPIRFISENLNCEVEWDSETRTVVIISKGTEQEVVEKSGRYFTTLTFTTDGGEITYKGEVILIDGEEVLDGEGTAILKDGTMKGNFVKGSPVGKMKVTFSDGEEGEAEIVGDLDNGTLKVTFPDGRRGELTFKDGEHHGKMKLFSPDGEVDDIDLPDII